MQQQIGIITGKKDGKKMRTILCYDDAFRAIKED